MTMIWASPTEARAYVDAQAAAVGRDEWPALPEGDAAVQTLIDSAARHLALKVIRWPILNDQDRAEDEEQRGHLVAAVCEVIRARLAAIATAKAAAEQLGGAGVAAVVASGGRVKAGSLEVQGGAGGSGAASQSTLPIEAYSALAAAGLIGGSVPAW